MMNFINKLWNELKFLSPMRILSNFFDKIQKRNLKNSQKVHQSLVKEAKRRVLYQKIYHQLTVNSHYLDDKNKKKHPND